MKNLNFLVGKNVSNFFEDAESFRFLVDGEQYELKLTIDTEDLDIFISEENSGEVTEVCIDIEEFEDDYEEVISLILFLGNGNSVSLSFIAYDNPYNLTHESLSITKVGI